MREAVLLARDQAAQPWHLTTVLQLDGPISRADLAVRIAERIGYAPRFRQKPGGTPAAWVDDAGMRVTGHLRQLTLPEGERFEDWLAADLSVRIDRFHPLWDCRIVDGLAGQHTAVVFRVQPALIDGDEQVHLVQELLDDAPNPITGPAPDWQPAEETDAGVAGLLANPLRALRDTAAGLAGMAASGLRQAAAETAPRHVAGVQVALDQVRRVRSRHGVRTHDVLLALATAGIREWLTANQRPWEDPLALVPLAVDDEEFTSSVGCVVAPQVIALPVTLARPAERLATLATLTQVRVDTERTVPGRDLAELAGFAPATLHALAAATVSQGRPHSVLVANAPGPEESRFLGERRVVGVHSVDSTVDDQQISVGITSYAGQVTLTATALAPLPGFARAVGDELGRLLGGGQ